MQLDILTCLKNIPTFSEVPESALLLLAESTRKKKYEKNSLIFNEGDPAGPLFIILSGKVRIYLDSASGKSVTLSIQNSGSYFGELSLLDDKPRSASIITVDPTLCAIIQKKAFVSWLKANPEDAKTLHELAVVQNDELVILEKISHQELANKIGASREMISKIMKDLSMGGYLSIKGKTIYILKPLPAGW